MENSYHIGKFELCDNFRLWCFSVFLYLIYCEKTLIGSLPSRDHGCTHHRLSCVLSELLLRVSSKISILVDKLIELLDWDPNKIWNCSLQIDHRKKDYKFGFGLTVGE